MQVVTSRVKQERTTALAGLDDNAHPPKRRRRNVERPDYISMSRGDDDGLLRRALGRSADTLSVPDATASDDSDYEASPRAENSSR